MLIVKNVFLPLKDRWVEGVVAVENGKYRSILYNGDANNGGANSFEVDSGGSDQILDFKDEEAYLIPAMIDPHVHVREPGYEYKEDWSTCSRAALKGGVATIIDMPNNKVPTDSSDALKIKRQIAMEKSYVNFGLYIALTDENSKDIAEGSYEKSICGIKIYMSKTTGGLVIDSEETIESAFYQTKPVLVHTGGTEGLKKVLSVFRRVKEKKGGTPSLYICHVSTKEEVSEIRKWKKEFSNIFAEVTPHHLFLDKNSYRGPKRVLPPLGSIDDQRVLWEAINDGIIGICGTDHAPHTLEEKHRENPPAGFPGLETAVPLLFNAMMEKRITLSRFLEITSETAEKIFGIEISAKILEGKDANFTVLIKNPWLVGEDGYETKCAWSPFDGMKVDYRPVVTTINGEVSYFYGEFLRKRVKQVCG